MADINTLNSLTAYYQNLIILQYRGKPKAKAEVGLFAGATLIDGLLMDIRDGFTLGQAVGVQLDLIGKYVGVTRFGYTFEGPYTLNDTDFTQLILMKIIQNSSDSTLASIQNFIARFFPNTVRVFDHGGMRMSYFFESAFGSNLLAEFFIEGGFLPKPMGVQLGSVIYSANINSFFGCRTYLLPGYQVNPLNTYSSYQTTWPLLSYGQAITG